MSTPTWTNIFHVIASAIDNADLSDDTVLYCEKVSYVEGDDIFVAKGIASSREKNFEVNLQVDFVIACGTYYRPADKRIQKRKYPYTRPKNAGNLLTYGAIISETGYTGDERLERKIEKAIQYNIDNGY